MFRRGTRFIRMKKMFIVLLLLMCGIAAASVDPRGPIELPGITPTLVPGGVEALGPAYDPAALRKPDPWRAEWIRPDGDPNTGAGIVSLLRKEVTFDQDPSRVVAWLTGEETFRLSINGKLAARGPVDNGRDFTTYNSGRWFYEGRDLTAFFHKGRNLIAVELFRAPFVNSSWRTGHAGFLFEAEATLGEKRTPITSDETWRGINGEQWQVIKGGAAFDATKEPAGWREDAFDDSPWKPCVNAGTWWQKLEPSEIPPRMEVRYPSIGIERASAGITGITGKVFSDGPVVVPGDGSFAVRFDRILSGYVGLKVKGGAGAVVTLEPNELDAPGHHRMATVVLRQGETAVELPFLDSFSTINVSIKGAKEPVAFEDVSAVFTSQPVAYRGTFECSDAHLNHLWQAERWATQICLQNHHLDSPDHQEPLSDVGDYLIEARVNDDTFGSPWLARQDLRKFAWILEQAGYRNFHTSYSLLWLQMLREYGQRTGDTALLKELAPNVFALLDRYTEWRGKNGLISEAPNYMFMDWVSIDGIPCHHPPAVIGQGYLTAFYYRGLADAQYIAELVGDTSRAAHFEQLRTEVRAAFNRELWVPEKDFYRDGKPNQTSVQPSKWLPADTDIETFSTQVNALAVLYQLAPEERRAALMDRLMQRPDLNTQPYFMHFVFDALADAGPGLYEKYATPQLRRWEVNPITQTAREMWGKGDWSHGWVATPVVQMSERILGISGGPTGPIHIEPRLCDLNWAKGKVPIGTDEVEVSWTRHGTNLHMEVEIPQRRSALVSLPSTPPKQVAVGAGKTSLDFQIPQE
jgi:alpha-L-rhamnosidase